MDKMYVYFHLHVCSNIVSLNLFTVTIAIKIFAYFVSLISIG